MADRSNLYNALYQNAEMGTDSIKHIFPKVHDNKLRGELRTQLSNYSDQTNMLSDRMRSQNMTPKPVSKMAKVMTSMGITLNCARDNSTQHIAEMLIQGTNMGIIKINKALNRSVTAEPELIRAAQEMLSKEQRYIDDLKSYL